MRLTTTRLWNWKLFMKKMISQLRRLSNWWILQLKTMSVKSKVMEENEKMRSLLEKLIASGKEQQQVICSLNEKQCQFFFLK